MRIGERIAKFLVCVAIIPILILVVGILLCLIPLLPFAALVCPDIVKIKGA